MNLNSLTSINPNIAKLQNLKVVHFDANNLNTFPGFDGNSDLEEINFREIRSALLQTAGSDQKSEIFKPFR
jgi:Leucine-rich repeat (LRR) protein